MKPLNGIIAYFQGVVVEARKVTWPTLPTVLQHFVSVVVGMALFTAFVGAIDYLFIKAVALLIK